jgi:hypothetical protein
MSKRLNYKQKQAYTLAAGWHPLAGWPLLDEPGHTCGDCAHRVCGEWCARAVSKCRYMNTPSATTDVKQRWPACNRWKAKEVDK